MPGNSLDNLTDQLRRALNPANSSFMNTSYQIDQDAFEPSRPHRQSYANGPKTVDNSMSMSNHEASPEIALPTEAILDLIDSDSADQEDPFALKF